MDKEIQHVYIVTPSIKVTKSTPIVIDGKRNWATMKQAYLYTPEEHAAVQGYIEALEKIKNISMQQPPQIQAIHRLAQQALSKAEEAGNYILITDVKNLFNASVFLYELMQVANIKNEDGMQVVEYINKPNGGSIAYLRHDAVVKKLNKILQSLPNHIGEANEMIAAKAEDKGEGVYQKARELSEIEYPYEHYRGKKIGINDEHTGQALRGAFVAGFEANKQPTNSLDELEYYQAERETFGLAVMNLDTQTQAICDSFILAFDRLLDCSKPQPTNSLDELERWVNRNWADGKMIIYPKDDLLSKIQELKTITPNNGWISVEDRLPELDKYGESAHCLCIADMQSDTPVVCFYNKERGWVVSNWKADSLPITVTHWQPLPPKP
jgi:Protein of unknown function (DUF551)